ncbi:hypothetical protein ACA910_001844 [Epithemia clementina (nom. ined.)]
MFAVKFRYSVRRCNSLLSPQGMIGRYLTPCTNYPILVNGRSQFRNIGSEKFQENQTNHGSFKIGSSKMTKKQQRHHRALAYWMQETGLEENTMSRVLEINPSILGMGKALVREKMLALRNQLSIDNDFEFKTLVDAIGQAKLLHKAGTKSSRTTIECLLDLFHHNHATVRSVLVECPSILNQSGEKEYRKRMVASLLSEILRRNKALYQMLPEALSMLLLNLGTSRARSKAKEEASSVVPTARDDQVQESPVEGKSSVVLQEPENAVEAPDILDRGRWADACQAVQGLSFAESLTEDEERHLALKSEPVLIDSTGQLLELENIFLHSFSAIGAPPGIVAVDVEFHEGIMSTFQIACCKSSNEVEGGTMVDTYVIDMLVATQDQKYQEHCRGFVEKLCNCHGKILVLGFNVRGDLKAIDQALGTSLFQESDTNDHLLDLQHVFGSTSAPQPSLATCTALFCTKGGSMTKTKHKRKVQHSLTGELVDATSRSWGTRPLTREQLEYAALDAAVLLVLLAEKSRTRQSTFGTIKFEN